MDRDETGGSHAAVEGSIEDELRALRQKERLLGAVIHNVPIVLWAVDRDGIFTFQDGKSVIAELGSYIGKSLYDIFPADNQVVLEVRRALAGQSFQTGATTETHGRVWESWLIPIQEGSEVDGVISLSLDVTELRRVEDELRAKLELIEQQRNVIRELAAPIIQVWDGVLTVPLLGVIDSGRLSDILENLLAEVTRIGARYAILDLTGVELLDTATADHLIRLVRALRLLGAVALITGIRPAVAQLIVSLGIELGEVHTLATLRDGLKLCMKQQAREAAGASPRAAPAQQGEAAQDGGPYRLPAAER